MNNTSIAVIDIGKTNKKVLIFDRDMSIIDSAYASFEEKVKDGIHYESVDETWFWVKDQLKALAKRHAIKVISVATHGATAMCIDAGGKLATPPVAYTTDAGERFSEEFFAAFGNRRELQRRTATAEIGSMVNVAKLLYFIQQKWPRRFAATTAVLYYPQYFGYLLTGHVGAEPTYTGCHTYLYDFEAGGYSSVAEKLGIADKLPANISKTWDSLGRIRPSIAAETGLAPDCIVTMGIHDSNASLLPYLVKGRRDFALNSTGTWCVAMHPSSSVAFRDDELGKLVFYNLDAFNRPVKTSIFMGGLEFDAYTTLLKQINNQKDLPPFNLEAYNRALREARCFILPSVVRGTGIFPDSAPRVIEGDSVYPLKDIQSGKAVPAFFRDYEFACAVCTISLALQTKKALSLIDFAGSGDIFTEGGFRHNDAYNALLGALFPDARVALTQLQEATAFGAAICGKAALEGVSPMDIGDSFTIETIDAPGARFESLVAYGQAFDAALNDAHPCR